MINGSYNDQSLLIWGASGHAKVVIDVVRSTGIYDVVGCIEDSNGDDTANRSLDLPVIGGRNKLMECRDKGLKNIFIAIGDNQARLQLAEIAKEEGFDIPTLIHSSAIVSDRSELGCGVLVCPSAVINPSVTVLDYAIINTGAIVEHDSSVGRAAHVCPGVTLAGHVTVGEGVWVGVGSTVIDNVTMHDHSFIGAGSVVVNDIEAGLVAYGVPARVHPKNDRR